MKARTLSLVAVLLLASCCLPVFAGLTAVTSGPQTIVKADTVNLTGTGALNGSVTLWIIGRNYFDTKIATPDKKGNFTVIIKPDETNKFSSGEYAFLLQDPGANKAFEITPLLWSDGIRIADEGKVITNIGQKSAFRADTSPLVGTIINVSQRTDVDDFFTPYYYYVEEPYVRFNRVSEGVVSDSLPQQTTGEEILITGTTNMGPENTLNVEIRNATSRELITTRSIPVEQGANANQWTYILDAPGLPAGSYLVTVGAQKYTTEGRASAQLNILEYRIAGTPATTQQPEMPLPGGETSYDVFLPLIISFAALLIIGIIMIVSLRK